MMESEQATPSEMYQTPTEKVKNLKKQEAGRKGAEVRRKKLEALQAQLVAKKEQVYSEYSERNKTVRTPSEPCEESTTHKPRPSSIAPGSDWIVGIGLILLAGACLFIKNKKILTLVDKPRTPEPTAEDRRARGFPPF